MKVAELEWADSFGFVGLFLLRHHLFGPQYDAPNPVYKGGKRKAPTRMVRFSRHSNLPLPCVDSGQTRQERPRSSDSAEGGLIADGDKTMLFDSILQLLSREPIPASPGKTMGDLHHDDTLNDVPHPDRESMSYDALENAWSAPKLSEGSLNLSATGPTSML
ncbi:uncharacterized protein SPSK_09954 [Sporothrix schenckii 1099-18]|uniref:Uncharacterized protein n=1 Tax=Sporothrix schenckii 1099-18 TaxID=1397361 RepID=A0A0F2MAI9_SPOSC|nr:uncharacterized protein SPSK_09954 [Sporothrix schenckii 1099-18]KJR85845.1 hypothetical protein SPSK_09954 [Sporothrix schenckii 1099-18]